MERYMVLFEDDHDYFSPILENTFDVEKDVNFLYKMGKFNQIIDSVREYLFQNAPHKLQTDILQNKDLIFAKIDSSELKDEDSRQAHKLNPVTIFLGVFKSGSIYDPISKIIYVSLNYNVLRIFLQYGKFGKNKIKSVIVKKSEKASVFNEITTSRIKSTIAHELSHWIDDSLHNNHIHNLLSRANDLKNSDILKLGQKNVSMTYFEIEAQIHGIKNLKKIKKKIWDTLTLTDVFFIYSSLRSIVIKILSEYDESVVNIWLKNLIKRMSRGGLLGKNMTKFPDIKKLTESMFSV